MTRGDAETGQTPDRRPLRRGVLNPPIPVLILAAGQSARMRGADKLLEPVDGRPLIRRQVEIVLAAGLAPFVALPAPDHPRALTLAGLDHRALALPGSAEGMGGTLRDGVAALPACPRFMVMAADLPGLTADDLRLLAATDPGDALIVIATGADGRFGHPILFDSSLRAGFDALGGDVGAKPLVKANKGRIRTVALPADHATRDLDTPEDWAAWRAFPRP